MKNIYLYLAVVSLLTLPTHLQADEAPIGDAVNDLPIFDAHMHYKQEAWDQFSPDLVLELMDKSGVAMALVSSTPDEGTIRLYEHAPNRIVPEVRPYHGGHGSTNWTNYEKMFEYIKGRMDKYPHVGIGEFHLHGVEDEDENLLRQIAKLALERGALLHIHSGVEPVEFMYSVEPNLTIIWAHAGFEPPALVSQTMDKYATLYADLSYREWQILDADGVSTGWHDVLTKHSDRFMVGTDTWMNGQWAGYQGLVYENRQWISHFPRELAEKFAYKNAERLFKRDVSRELLGTR